MPRRSSKKTVDPRFTDFADHPLWPTTLRTALPDGRCIMADPSGKDRISSMSLYHAVPLVPVLDARSTDEVEEAGAVLADAFEELGRLSRAAVTRRSVAKGSYRDFHLLLVNVPQPYHPPQAHPLSETLEDQFGGYPTFRRVLLLGTRLIPRINTKNGVGGVVDSVVETLVNSGSPMSDFDEDFETVSAAFARAGLHQPDDSAIRFANSWWNDGRHADTPLLPHPEHLHVFETSDAVRTASHLGFDTCAAWEDSISGERTYTMATLSDFDFGFSTTTKQPNAAWVSRLLSVGAAMVSIRGKVEPPKVTREELRRQRKRYIDDINERRQAQKMSRAEQDEMLAMLGEVEAVYAQGGPPTLTEMSTIVALHGRVNDVQRLTTDVPFELAVMAHRQAAALGESMLCSPARSNPYLKDEPSQMVAYSGIQSLSFVGDRDGALVGWTERDRQPAYLSPTAASNEDVLPLMLVPGATGSGKTYFMQWLAWQLEKIKNRVGDRTPVVMINPKPDSDLSATVLHAGGQVSQLSDLTTADGIFDPIRFSRDPAVGKELAVSLLGDIDPWREGAAYFETDLTRAISHGVDRGANCVGQALEIAQRDIPDLPEGMVDQIFNVIDAIPQARALVGRDPKGTGLRIADGITLIQVGDGSLNLPEAGTERPTLPQRVAMALVRMMVFGSSTAVSSRQGVVMFDEAWVFTQAGKTEMERLGRLARSQEVLPILFTQRVSDALEAGLEGYIGRGLILSIEDAKEARAACQLFRLEPTEERMKRITGKKTKAGRAEGSVAHNWDSLKALIDPRTREVLRGSVGYYIDLSGSAVPVEIVIPEWFAKIASTNPEDIRRRQQEAEMAEQALLTGEGPATSSLVSTHLPA